jgi:hypothetical protein
MYRKFGGKCRKCFYSLAGKSFWLHFDQHFHETVIYPFLKPSGLSNMSDQSCVWARLIKLSPMYIVGGCIVNMATENVASVVPEQSRSSSVGQVTGTGTPAEDREEERALYSLWNLKEDAKWGKDIYTQKKAIRDLAGIGTPARSYLEEVLSVLTPGDTRDYCQEAMNNVTRLELSETKKNVKAVR